MCPICISAAALATMAGTGSAGGLAAAVATTLRIKQRKGSGSNAHDGAPKTDQQSHTKEVNREK